VGAGVVGDFVLESERSRRRRDGEGGSPSASRRVWVAFLCVLAAGPARFGASPARAQDPSASRQVTVFGIVASPNDNTLDPRLRPIGAQLRRLFPGHGFKLVGVDTQRIGTGQSGVFELDGSFQAQVQLLSAFDANGKAQLRFELDHSGQLEFATLLTTPLNQLSFCDRRFSDGSRLVIGVGVRE
jgi:hypothetical protein